MHDPSPQNPPAPEVSLIVPTINESENLPALLDGISKALAGTSFEVIIVDDNSKDATPQVCAELAKTYPVRLLVRSHPTNGLSGAVLHGMAQARGQYFAVMDADLQHPPEKLPELLAPLRSGEADFVLGSRYMPGGSTANEWGVLRKMNSRLATLFARPIAAPYGLKKNWLVPLFGSPLDSAMANVSAVFDAPNSFGTPGLSCGQPENVMLPFVILFIGAVRLLERS